ncbi:protocatechuate 3,4-dioxygenase [Pelagicoccus mobilis]|uniref:Intradiol ring-cleavage dioxygenases domain-containing protein n=1 Tax=Pelagicoccus mobilis TaxID=415221 RepID=A0A934RXZ6_9BACT|nr:protocatechuate 3,4-dioxygenase [Pelagicoccus mobilis]MBK1878822.1 hypothetical protein [Pelagicoccus mobilis]
MSTDPKINRRTMLRTSLGVTAGTVASTLSIGKGDTTDCTVSPKQTEGPFYPIHEQEDKDVDLTRVKGRKKRAKGKVVNVRGRILDQNCEPLAGVMVEVWQANAAGRYSHEKDTNPAPLDPNFQSWGQTTTDQDGYYGFKTIKPGAYPLNPERGENSPRRPPHIHFRVAKRGYHELVTQCYFPGEALNETDSIFQALSKKEQKKLILVAQDSPKEAIYHLDLHLQAAESANSTTDSLEQYVGRYQLEESGTLKYISITREGTTLYAEIDAFFPKIEIIPNERRRYSLDTRQNGYEIDFDTKRQKLTLYRSDAPTIEGTRTS